MYLHTSKLIVCALYFDNICYYLFSQLIYAFIRKCYYFFQARLPLFLLHHIYLA